MGQSATFLSVVALYLMLNALTNGLRPQEITKNGFTPPSSASQPVLNQPGAFSPPNIPFRPPAPGFGHQPPPFSPSDFQNRGRGLQASPVSSQGFQDPHLGSQMPPFNPPGFQGTNFGPQTTHLNQPGPQNPSLNGPGSSIPNFFSPPNSQNFAPNSFRPQDFGKPPSFPQNFLSNLFPPNFNNPMSSPPNSFGPQNSGPNSFHSQGPSFSNPRDSTVPQGSTFQAPPHNPNSQDFRPSYAGPQQTDPRYSGPQQTDPRYFGPHQASFKPGHHQTNSRPDHHHTSFRPDHHQTSFRPGPISSGPKEIAPSSSGIEPTRSSSIPQQPSSNSATPQRNEPLPSRNSHNQHSNIKPHTHHHYEHHNDEDPLNGLRIVCIYPASHFYKKEDFEPQHIEPELCTHLNYEFATLDPKTLEMQSGDPALDSDMYFYQQATDLKTKNSKLKVLLSLGGWRDSTQKYSDLAANPDKRKNFIDKAIPFIMNHGFDGMDLAWEYPNCWQGAIGANPDDKQNFVTFLKEMKPEFEKNNLTLSVSVGAVKREVEAAYDVPAISNTVDYINVMTYDMHGPWESKTGHHAQFKAMPGDTDEYCNTVGGMNVWIDMGADKKKLNMGMPMYGTSFTLKDPNENGMGAPTVGIGNAGPDSGEGGLLLYNEVCRYLNDGNWTEKRDENAGFYAFSGDQWVCYDPPMMEVDKTKYVVEKGMGGVLLKHLGGDDYRGECFSVPFPLLRMINLEMREEVRRMRRHGG